MSARRNDFDAITFEVVRNALDSLADEMALILMRSAYSPVVRDSMDYSTALCDRDGNMSWRRASTSKAGAWFCWPPVGIAGSSTR